MPTATNVRSGRRAALLAAVQSALGTPVTNFSAAPVVFSTSAEIPVSPEKARDLWMTNPVAPGPEEDFTVSDKPAGRLEAHATPSALDLLLRSNWGPKTGNYYILKTQVNEWLTLGWVENGAAGDIGEVVRIQDAWVHRLTFHAPFPRGILEVTGAYLGRLPIVNAKGTGGLTFPGSWSTEKNPFTVNAAAFVRDPAGANVSIRLRDLEIILDQNAADHEWDMGALLHQVVKAGPTVVWVDFTSEVSDEAWAVIKASRAGTRHDFRFTATAQSPAKTLTITLNEVSFTFEEIGHDGLDMREIRGTGMAHLKTGVPATISIA
jgi:hypothetical protein